VELKNVQKVKNLKISKKLIIFKSGLGLQIAIVLHSIWLYLVGNCYISYISFSKPKLSWWRCCNRQLSRTKKCTKSEKFEISKKWLIFSSGLGLEIAIVLHSIWLYLVGNCYIYHISSSKPKLSCWRCCNRQLSRTKKMCKKWKI
jgi:hypothetical protein